ncbi:hypothetical protein DICVIV_00419 [Dictyocaulus viviparus]|uniref:Uncharacterized protein n=1 Tax=Dictyocaulus viviparus TaxID=29172 RepID=A0A0D8YF80_DICVI|nr:hypothetical protein DICVIV_00419 [Dictyocaulus viviparus]
MKQNGSSNCGSSPSLLVTVVIVSVHEECMKPSSIIKVSVDGHIEHRMIINHNEIPFLINNLDTLSNQLGKMNEEAGYLGAMTYQCLYSGVLDKLRLMKRDDDRTLAAIHMPLSLELLLFNEESVGGLSYFSAGRLRSAMKTSDNASPSFLFDFTKILLAGSELNINLQEAYLRMHSTSPTDDLIVHGQEHISEYKELTKRLHEIHFLSAVELRRILSRVPEEMSDRHQFLETIKLIASSIKKLLEAINAVHQIVPQTAQQAVEKRKREFVHYSKRFSNTLKTYFKDQNAVQVSVSANQLVFQTSLIIKTINEKLKK